MKKRGVGLLFVLCMFALMIAGCAGPIGTAARSASIPREAKDALHDAAAYADEMAERYAHSADATTDEDAEAITKDAEKATGKDNGATTGHTYDELSTTIDEGLARVQADIDTVQNAEGVWPGRDEAIVAMENLQSALNYERDILEAQNKARNAPEGAEGIPAIVMTMNTLSKEYANIDPPACLAAYLSNTIDTMPTFLSAMGYAMAEPDSTLAQYTSQELVSWWLTKQTGYDAESDDILVDQCHASRDLMTLIAEGKETPTKPAVEVDMIDRVAPNLYPSLDSAANVGITAYDNAHAVLVEAEVVGFTQKFEQRYDLAQGHNYLPVKPAMIPIQALPNLTSNTTTQLNIKVTDADSNDVLAQESHEVELLSLYDFAWVNDEFGSTAAFDILAWLRPQASEVNAINRAAADVLAGWKIEPYSTIAGYQYGNDVFATLLQVAAIQKAISDAGVAYVMDAYSFTSDQHVLTPDAVVQQKHGLCIETSLLMASCLMSAGMHPLLIITPTHAQVAVETYAGSGNYFLIETIILPYSGVNLSLDKTSGAFYNGLLASNTVAGTTHYWTTTGSSDEWKAYLEHTSNGSGQFGGNFVVDCSLQPIMGLQGLENI